MKYLVLLLVLAQAAGGWWRTPDQQGQALMQQKRFADAAQAFVDPMWRGVAWYRAGEFEKATQSFARLQTPEARYNLGNAWMLLGKYEQAQQAYEQALADRPDWSEAQQNRDLAIARGQATKNQGGDMGDQKLGADDVVFDKQKKTGGEDTEIAGAQTMSDSAVQAIWLRQVQTQPADFLKSKFAYQAAQPSDVEEEP